MTLRHPSATPAHSSTLTRLNSERPRPTSGSVSADGKAQKASFYKRPSKAIEMGGGFFIPGLEGYRLRLATALLVFALLVLNRFPGYDPTQSQLTSEVIGAGAAVVLLAQALVEKVITDAAARADDLGDFDVVQESSSSSSQAAASAGPRRGAAGILEECPGIAEAGAEDDARWAGYALSENLGAPAAALLHQEKGLLYRRLPAAKAAGEGVGPAATEVGQALAQTLPKSVRRAYGMGDALAPWGGAGGSVAKGLAVVLGLPQAEGVVVVRVGDKAVLAVAPPAGGIMREQAMWVERAAALLEQAGLGK